MNITGRNRAWWQRIYWHSRRGMLELDLLLLPFVAEMFADLSQREQELYEQLIAREDQQLYAWLVSGSEAPEAKFAPIVGKILTHNGVPNEAHGRVQNSAAQGKAQHKHKAHNEPHCSVQNSAEPPDPAATATFYLHFPVCECTLRSIVYALAAAAPWLSALPLWAPLLLNGLLACLIWQDSRNWRQDTRLHRIVFYEQRAMLHYGVSQKQPATGAERKVETSLPKVLLLWEAIVILRFRATQGRKTHRVVIWPDSLSSEQQRHLRRLLR